MTLEDIVHRANANEALMDGTTGPVLEICDAADIVFAVWQDGDADGGVSTLLLKGQDQLETISSTQKAAVGMKWTSLKVIDRNMALAARDMLAN